MRSTLILITIVVALSAVPPFTWAGDATPAAPTTQPSTLQLLPATAADKPSVADALTASRWVWAGMRNILGVGTDEFIDFRQTADHGLVMEDTYRSYPSVNDRKAARGDPPFTDRKLTTGPCRVEGPILRYDDQQQTFVVVPGKTLILNAVVPLGDGKWYYTTRQVWGKGQVRDEEMLFDFADDPYKHDEGKGTIQIRSGDAGKVLKQDVRFTLLRADKQGRIIRVVADDATNRTRWAEVMLAEGGAYGLMLDQPNRNSRVFTPATKKE